MPSGCLPPSAPPSCERFARNILLACVSIGLSAVAPTVFAQAAAGQTARSVARYDIPAGTLDQVLNRFAAQAGVLLAVDGTLTVGKTSTGLSGDYGLQDGFRAILANSGLEAVAQPKGGYALQKATSAQVNPAPAAAPPDTTLPTVRVTASPESLGDLPKPYAGGQIARGGHVGMLGDKDVMDTPFSQTSYTNKAIQDQQARTVQDVLNNDPSVVASTSSGTPHDFQVIRGFGGFGTDGTRTLNGVPGMAPLFFPSTDYVERVEILKGPSALLNGMGLSSAAVSGTLGGSVNLVTKQATKEPITQLTTRYVSNSQLGTHLDVGRRFGESKEFGIRFNGSVDGGHTPIDTQHSRLETAALNLDYSGERVRLSADFSHQSQKLDPSNPYIYARNVAGSLTTFPHAPSSTISLVPSGSEQTTKSDIALIRGEFDLHENLTAYAAIGKQRAEYRLNGFEYAWLLDGAGQYGIAPAIQRYTRDVVSMQGGVRAKVTTGAVDHALSLNLSRSDLEYKQAESEGTFYTIDSIYNPVFPSMSAAPDPGAAKKTYEVKVPSIGFADTLSVLNGRVQLLAGIRHQEVKIKNFNTTTGAPSSEYDAKAWTPSLGLIVKPLDNVSLYANYIEDLRPGATVSTAYANAGEVFSPYVSKQYETGMKVDWGRVLTTLAVFQIAMPNSIAVNDPGGGLPTLTQDGEQRNRGIEMNAFGELTPHVRLMGGVTFIDPIMTKTEGGTLDGKRNDTTPKVRAVIGAEWDAPFMEKLTLTSRLTHTGNVLVSAGSDVTIPSWTTLDLGARYSFNSPWNEKPVILRFNVDNVFDKDYLAGAYAAGLVHRGQPRTFRLSATVNF